MKRDLYKQQGSTKIIIAGFKSSGEICLTIVESGSQIFLHVKNGNKTLSKIIIYHCVDFSC